MLRQATASTNLPTAQVAGSSDASGHRDLDLGRIYRAHAESVSRWARRLVGPEGEIDDLVHEVFLVAQRKLPGFRGESKISTWLYAITIRVVQHHRRKNLWRRWLWPKSRNGMAAAEWDQVPGATPTPLEALESRRATILTHKILDQLPEIDRTLLILFEIEGLPGEEIAALTGNSLSSVWVRLHRARARFMKNFIDWEKRAHVEESP